MAYKNLEIQRLRALGTLIVLYGHYKYCFLTQPSINNSISYYFYGQPLWGAIDLFLVISGYVVANAITAPIDHYRHSFVATINYLQDYFIRRFLRIFPVAFTIFSIVLLCTYFFDYRLTGNYNSTAQTLLAGKGIISLTFNYLLSNQQYHAAILAPFWYLSIEDTFYLCMPFFLLLIPSIRLRVILLLSLLFVTTFYVRIYLGVDKFFATHVHGDGLIYGCLLQIITQQPAFADIKNSTQKNNLLLTGFSIITIMLLLQVTTFLHSISIAIPAVCLLSFWLVFMAALEKNIIPYVSFLEPTIKFIAKRSYSIYLSQIPIIYLSKIFFIYCGVSSLGLQTSLFLGLLFIGVELLYQCIERPFMILSFTYTSSPVLMKQPNS